MKKNLFMLLIACALVFTCAFDVIYDPNLYENENGIAEDPVYADPVIEDPQEIPLTEDPAIDQPLPEEPVFEPVIEEEPAEPDWEGMDKNDLARISAVYDEMTDTGKLYSGWFRADNIYPCTWQGITCEEGKVIGLDFENAGYFTHFPASVMDLFGLKELHMVGTMMRGPLPEDLFAALPQMEILELKGNFLSGELPKFPDPLVYFPMIREITISDNLEDDTKMQMLYAPEYADVAYYRPNPYTFPDADLTPGLSGSLPENWNQWPLLTAIDLSENRLSGPVPDSWGSLPFTKLDLRGNGDGLEVSERLYDALVAKNNPEISLEGLLPPLSIEEPVQIPTEEPVYYEPTAEPVYVEPTAEPFTAEITDEPVTSFQLVPADPVQTEPTEVPYIPPTEVPIAVPTEVPPTPVPPTEIPPQKVVIVVVTATPEPTAVPHHQDPQPQYYYPTAQPQYYYPTAQPQYYYPTATPYTYYNPGWVYPTATPYTYYNPNWVYPTATPYTNYNPGWIYPTATSAYSYPQYAQTKPTATAVPTRDPVSQLGFTYVLEAMTNNNIPMTWRYTGMSEYSINYLDASGNLYPAFAMEWTPASKVCNASACNAVVTVPNDLLQSGRFSLQLRVRDASGRTYVSDPVEMEVASAQPAPTPTPEPQGSFLSDFLNWLFGPIIRLFSGK